MSNLKKPDLEGLLAFQIKHTLIAERKLRAPIGKGFGSGEQFRFARPLKRGFTCDFAWPERRLLVEVQGGIWIEGGHSTGRGIERDIEKSQLAAVLGFTLLPVSEKDIRSLKAIKLIGLILDARSDTAYPDSVVASALRSISA